MLLPQEYRLTVCQTVKVLENSSAFGYGKPPNDEHALWRRERPPHWYFNRL